MIFLVVKIVCKLLEISESVSSSLKWTHTRAYFAVPLHKLVPFELISPHKVLSLRNETSLKPASKASNIPPVTLPLGQLANTFAMGVIIPTYSFIDLFNIFTYSMNIYCAPMSNCC